MDAPPRLAGADTGPIDVGARDPELPQGAEDGFAVGGKALGGAEAGDGLEAMLLGQSRESAAGADLQQDAPSATARRPGEKRTVLRIWRAQ